MNDLVPCGHITTVESFWAYYSHMLKPSDLPANMDVCFFKEGCQPLSDDLPNIGGGKWTLREGYLPGDVGFDPLGMKPKDEAGLLAMQDKELNNGRLAMIAVAGMTAQELVTGTTLF